MSKETETINFLRKETNDKNINLIISEILKRLNEAGKDATQYKNDYGDGSFSISTLTLGANKMNGWSMGGYLSSDREFISDNIRINVMSGLGSDIVDTTMGDCTEAYEMLIRRLQKLDKANFEDVMREVYLTTSDYFGGVENVDIDERKGYYEELGDKEATGVISELKGKTLAACTERAALSQNLLKFLGFDAVFKVSQITNVDKEEVHAYNLVAHDGKYYIFDATIPRIDEKGEITPLVAEIPKEVFETLSHPLRKDDVSVKTEYDSVRGHRKIHYNSWSKNVYDTTKKTKEDPDDPGLGD